MVQKSENQSPKKTEDTVDKKRPKKVKIKGQNSCFKLTKIGPKIQIYCLIISGMGDTKFYQEQRVRGRPKPRGNKER